jgi:hypothetical protein
MRIAFEALDDLERLIAWHRTKERDTQVPTKTLFSHALVARSSEVLEGSSPTRLCLGGTTPVPRQAA